MEMTKQRKMLIGVLCLGLGGLAVDRFVIGAPESAAADDEVITVEATPPPAPPPALQALAEPTSEPEAAGESPKALPSYASLAQRLIQAKAQAGDPAPTDEQADPFALPEQWRAAAFKPTQQQPTDPNAKQHAISGLIKLDGTMHARSLVDGKEELVASISGGGLDGRLFRKEQIIRIPNDRGSHDRYKLEEIGSRYVVWLALDGGYRIRMEVEKDL